MSRARGLLPLAVPCALAVACSDPELASELDSGGPPEVVQVNVASETAPQDPNQNAIEAATFCRPGEQYDVSTFYCPLERDSESKPIPGDRELDAPVSDAVPVGWHTRLIFSELLDPDVEDLVTEDGVTTGTLAETQPAILRCGEVELDYDGWYDPTGNFLSYPPGPSLVVHALEFIATGTLCEVELVDNVVDKDGNAVPSSHRGPYEFTIAALSVTGSVPADASQGVATDSVVEISFNAPINDATVTDRIVVTAGDTPVAGELGYKTDPETGEPVSDQIIVFTPDAALEADTTYTVAVSNEIEDIKGGLLDQEEPFTASFTTAQ